jgi:isopentenyl phosphate kinase
MRLLLGHGSGSFGHVPAQRYDTRAGVHSPREWIGYANVWLEARALDQIVIEALNRAGLPAIAFPPSAAVTAADGHITAWDLAPLQSALDHHLLPVIQGDVAIDTIRGGTILSTEDLFCHLAGALRPERILLAGVEDGVWQDYPARTRLQTAIHPGSLAGASARLQGSAAVDVTGGMRAKVGSMLTLVDRYPGLEILIFSGVTPGLLKNALLGAAPGTKISNVSQGGQL